MKPVVKKYFLRLPRTAEQLLSNYFSKSACLEIIKQFCRVPPVWGLSLQEDQILRQQPLLDSTFVETKPVMKTQTLRLRRFADQLPMGIPLYSLLLHARVAMLSVGTRVPLLWRRIPQERPIKYWWRAINWNVKQKCFFYIDDLCADRERGISAFDWR